MRIVLLVLLVLLVETAWADDPPTLNKTKPPYERLLTGEDANTAATLDKRIAELAGNDKYAEAVKAAEELAALRTRVQGEDHWQIRDARLLVRLFKGMETLPEAEREKIREADQANNQGAMYFSQRKYADAQPLFVKALTIRRKVLGEDSLQTAVSYDNLASNLDAQGKHAEAQPLFEKALAIYRRTPGEEHPHTATCYHNLASNLTAQGRHAEAQPLFEKALASQRRVLGEEHLETALAYCHLAVNLQTQGKLTEAQPFLEQALAISRKIFGEEHFDTATPYDNLANNLYSQGKYAEAQPLLEKALAIRRKLLGEEHPYTVAAFTNLAATLQAQGKYAEAQPLYEKSLTLRRKTLGEQHPATAQGYNNLANNLHEQGMYAEAQMLYEKSLTILRKVRGEDHTDTATGYNNLAMNLNAQGKYAEAQPLYQKALGIRRTALGEEHPDTATGYNNLASILISQGKYAEAQPLCERTLAIRRKVQGEEHPLTATGYNNLAMNLNAQGKFAEAQPLFDKALAIFRKVLGDESPSTATGHINLALNLHAQGKYAEAQPLYEKALTLRRKTLGEEHPNTAEGYNNLALNLHAQARYAEAQPLFDKALAISRKVLGEEHPLTATSYSNLALNLHAQGKFAEAQPLFEKALAIKRRVLGEEHPQTAGSAYNLAFNLNAQGKTAEALRTLDEASRSYECSRLISARGLERSVATGSRSPYSLTAALLARQGRFAEAWENLEHDLARGLLDEQMERRASTLTADERSQQARLSDRLVAIRARNFYLLTHTPRSKAEQAELEDLSSERRRLESDLADLAVGSSKREVAALGEVRKALPVDTAFVTWVDVFNNGTEEHWGCVVRSTGDPVWERLPGTGPQNTWTRQDNELPWRLRVALIGDRTTAPASAAEVAALARDLDAQRLAPLEKHLKGVKSLYVVPVRRMSGVPVEVLTERYRISYVPSATYLVRLNARPRPTGERVLALGDPRLTSTRANPSLPLAPLPPGGLLVTQVVPTGNAAAARIVPDDVLLAYAGVDLQNVEQLPKLIAEMANEKTVEVTVWRDGKTAVRQVAAGRLGVVLHKDPAPRALAAKREADQLLASVRGGDWKELPGTRVELARLTDLFGKDKVTILADVGATEPALDALRIADRLKDFRYLHFATHGEANHVSAFESRLILVQDAAARETGPAARWSADAGRPVDRARGAGVLEPGRRTGNAVGLRIGAGPCWRGRWPARVRASISDGRQPLGVPESVEGR